MDNCENYTVAKGDTLFSLARKFGISAEDIIMHNKGVELATLKEGDIICLPKGGALLRELDIDLPKSLVRKQEGDYTVKEDDSIVSIAEKFGISIEQLLFANSDLNPGYIRPNTVIIIPSKDVPLPGSYAYTVKQGDTLLGILDDTNLSYGRLKLFNQNKDLTDLKEGDVIFIPNVRPSKGDKCKIGSYSYRIKQEDTLSSIAKKFNLSIEDLLRFNAFKDFNDLKPGSLICLPLLNLDDLL